MLPTRRAIMVVSRLPASPMPRLRLTSRLCASPVAPRLRARMGRKPKVVAQVMYCADRAEQRRQQHVAAGDQHADAAQRGALWARGRFRAPAG